MKEIFIKGLIEKTAAGGYRVIASTAAIDRQGDSIDQSGWDTLNFMKNPVMLWAHDYSSLPVAKVLALPADARGLVADYEFAPAEGNPMAAQLKILVDEGFVNAVSVGFIPKERNGNVITKAELLEISFVPVPANQEALVTARSKGVSDEMLSKIFEQEQKGAVADELSAEEALEKKWANLNEVWDIMSAFCGVYLDETVEVDAFKGLLAETITLLGGLAGADEAKSEEYKKSLTLKLDAIKSEIAKGNVHMGIASLSKEFAVLLKDAPATVEEDIPAEVVEPAIETTTETEGGVDEVRALLITRSLLREDNSKTHSSLTAVNELLKARGAK